MIDILPHCISTRRMIGWRYIAVIFAFALMPHMVMARDQIRIVGSSTVFPFVASAAEHFGKLGKFRTPIVEATGTGGGIKIFCSGIDLGSPDMVNASRPIKDSEVALCKSNGVHSITELSIGYDGIVMANANSSPRFDLSKRELFLALVKRVPVNGKLVENPYTHWSQITSHLPDVPISVYGPPPSSGTRDAFTELLMQEGCKQVKAYAQLIANADDLKAECARVREDGAFIEAGENDNLIVQKLVGNPNALGVFGYSFLEQNAGSVKANPINGVMPGLRAIISGDYTLARSLFVYVKNGHVGKIPGLAEFATLLTSDAASGHHGFLILKGLLPLHNLEHEVMKKRAAALGGID
jgi:phosphate transport system substrate-binding protein